MARLVSDSTKVYMGCNVSHYPGHGHKATCPSWTSTTLDGDFIPKASIVTTVGLGLCTCVSKCVCAQDLPRAASITMTPPPFCLASLLCRGPLMLLAGEKEKSPRQTAIDGCSGGGTDRYWRYRWARQTPEQIERYLEQRDTAGGIGR